MYPSGKELDEGGHQTRGALGSSSSHRMYFLISFRKSTPQHNCSTYCLHNAFIDESYKVNSPTRFVNLFFTITNQNLKSIILWGSWLSKTNYKHIVSDKDAL